MAAELSSCLRCLQDSMPRVLSKRADFQQPDQEEGLPLLCLASSSKMQGGFAMPVFVSSPISFFLICLDASILVILLNSSPCHLRVPSRAFIHQNVSACPLSQTEQVIIKAMEEGTCNPVSVWDQRLGKLSAGCPAAFRFRLPPPLLGNGGGKEVEEFSWRARQMMLLVPRALFQV